MEARPDALLALVPWAVSLCDELGLADDLIPSGRPRRPPMVQGPAPPPSSGIDPRASDLTSFDDPLGGILSPWGVLRAGADLVLPDRMPSSDVSVGTLVRYRLGRLRGDTRALPAGQAGPGASG